MSDAPAPSQTDYPYAPRVPAGPLLEEPSPPAPRFGRWAERLENFLDGQPAHDDQSDDDWSIVGGPTIFLIPWPLIVICVFAAVNVIPVVLTSMFDPPQADWVRIAICAPLGGMIAGEFTVFSFALVWSQGSFLLRLLVHWFLAFALYGCWATAFVVASSLGKWGGGPLEFAGHVLLALPAIFLAVQAPLWCLRIYGAWKLEHENAPKLPTRNAALISDMLWGTAIAAIALTALRAMHHSLKNSGDPFWIPWAIGLLAVMLISLFTVAPLLRLILGLRSKMLAALGICAYWAFLNALVFSGSWYFSPGDWREITLCVSLMTLTGFLTTAVPLVLLRSAGYRLRIGK